MISSTDNLTRLLVIMSQLRAPDMGCPWDCKQTFESIVPHTLEEAYEVADAIERNDVVALKDELGDLLFQVVFYTQLAIEQDLFDFDEVAKVVCDKLIRRHPHVFDDACFEGEQALSAAWEDIKARERSEQENVGHPSRMDGIAKTLPELTRAHKLQKRASRVGFDWTDPYGIFSKIEEELEEVRQVLNDGQDDARLQEEIGDALFALVNLSRHVGVDPEQALRLGNRKFEQRFREIEQRLTDQGRRAQECSLEELNGLWEEIKRRH
jgi:ATP diphosphatase